MKSNRLGTLLHFYETWFPITTKNVRTINKKLWSNKEVFDQILKIWDLYLPNSHHPTSKEFVFDNSLKFPAKLTRKVTLLSTWYSLHPSAMFCFYFWWYEMSGKPIGFVRYQCGNIKTLSCKVTLHELDADQNFIEVRFHVWWPPPAWFSSRNTWKFYFMTVQNFPPNRFSFPNWKSPQLI